MPESKFKKWKEERERLAYRYFTRSRCWSGGSHKNVPAVVYVNRGEILPEKIMGMAPADMSLVPIIIKVPGKTNQYEGVAEEEMLTTYICKIKEILDAPLTELPLMGKQLPFMYKKIISRRLKGEPQVCATYWDIMNGGNDI